MADGETFLTSTPAYNGLSASTSRLRRRMSSEPQTLAHVLALQADRPTSAARPALLFESEVYNYADLERASNRVAWALVAAGVRPGQVVCQVLASRPELVVNLFGVLKAGATYAPLNPTLTERELRFQLADCRPAAMIVDAPRA